MSTLYLVATPIGNLGDLSYRAAEILRSVPVIAAEDTRTTKTLLDHYQISTAMISYHEHSQENRVSQLLDHLSRGNVALVSDAGSPGINDPGYTLINAAIQAGHQVSPIPGPSAPIAAVTASGFPTDRFLYLGYFPRKSNQRIKVLEEYRSFPHTLVILEAPHRLNDALVDILAVMGDREIAAARELTKLHEEILRGKVSELIDHFTHISPRGEFTLVLTGFDPSNQRWSESELIAEIETALREGKQKPSRLARDLARRSGWDRKAVYNLIQDLPS